MNVSKCPFCEYHVAGEYKKMAPRRGGFTDSLLPTGFRRSGGSRTAQRQAPGVPSPGHAAAYLCKARNTLTFTAALRSGMRDWLA